MNNNVLYKGKDYCGNSPNIEFLIKSAIKTVLAQRVGNVSPLENSCWVNSMSSTTKHETFSEG